MIIPCVNCGEDFISENNEIYCENCLEELKAKVKNGMFGEDDGRKRKNI
jgi:predicted amidophosphoribosyltransferase